MLHPELFHYTDFDGLHGIISNDTLWATHYSMLNDRTEIDFVKLALNPYVTEKFLPGIRGAARQRLSIQRNVRKLGGLKSASKVLAEEVLSAVHGAAFGNGVLVIAHPYIASFCSHAANEEYERSSGLLSQWRGYGGNGGYCVVFDTESLVTLLNREAQRYFWLYGNVDAVTYSNDDEALRAYGETISRGCVDCADIMLNGAPFKNFDDLLLPYLRAATHIKHRGFIEEREVRIVVCPITEDQVETLVPAAKESFDEFRSTHPAAVFKPICVTPKGRRRRYVTLFEGQHDRLPIKRVIVGPSESQKENLDRAATLLGKRRIPIMCSETPFIGQQA